MATKQYRPALNWTPDTKLPQRFATWKSEIEDEVLLFEGEDKPAKYICNVVKVCSGERGKPILKEEKVDKEEKDYHVILDALEERVKPTNEEISACTKYFYLRQGQLTLAKFYKQATEIVNAMNIESNPKDKTLRNLLLNGLASKEIYTQCLKKKGDELTSKRVMEIATDVEARKLMAEDLSEMAKQPLPNNAVATAAGNATSGTTEPLYRIRNEPAYRRRCGWCGSSPRCQRNECPARDSKCNLCGKMGHWEKACRSKSDHKGTPSKLHDLTSSERNQMPDDIPEADFKTLSTHPDPEAPHLRPMWFSQPLDGIVHLVEAEVDSGAGCNAFPLPWGKYRFLRLPFGLKVASDVFQERLNAVSKE
jgi:hypothetical protein